MKKNVNISTRSLTVFSVDCGGDLGETYSPRSPYTVVIGAVEHVLW